MRKRPVNSLTKKEEEFLSMATADKANAEGCTEDLHKYVQKPQKWPIDERYPTPSLADGSNLKKPILVNLSEKEWESVTRHAKSLNISKTEWIKYAIYKVMEEEQLHFFKAKNRVNI